MSTPFQCADLSPKGIRCPVVRCNEETGRFLFQLLDFENFRFSARWLDWVSDLPLKARLEKYQEQELARLK